MRDTKNEAPDFTNAEGVQWWHEPTLTLYAFSKGVAGVRVWTVHRPDGHRTRLLTEGQNILAEDQTLEGLGIKIALLAFQQQTPNVEPKGSALLRSPD